MEGLPGTLSCELSQFKHLCGFLGPYIDSGGLGAALGGLLGTGRGVHARRGAAQGLDDGKRLHVVVVVVVACRPGAGRPKASMIRHGLGGA